MSIAITGLGCIGPLGFGTEQIKCFEQVLCCQFAVGLSGDADALVCAY